MGLDARLKMARLAVIAFADPDVQRTVDLTDQIMSGGADMLQLRLEQVPADRRREVAEAARSIAFQHPRSLLVIRDDVAVATAMGADVLHVGAADVATADARTGLHEFALVGRSAHDADALDRALADDGVAYATLGPVFQDAGAAFRSGGLDMVREAARHHDPAQPGGKPWFAQGGIELDTLPQVLEAGARRVVVGQAVVGASDVEAATRAFSDAMTQAWDGDEGLQRLVLAAARPSVGGFVPVDPQQ